jgi:hypothetical protein
VRRERIQPRRGLVAEQQRRVHEKLNRTRFEMSLFAAPFGLVGRNQRFGGI